MAATGAVHGSDGVKIIPWVEVNDAAGPNHPEIRTAVAGLRIWRSITDTAIVSVSPGQGFVYRELKRRVPDMRIIPGLKTWTLLPSFDSIGGWQCVAREVAGLVEAAREETVVLENETAIKDYLDGQAAIDLERLRAALDQLPKELTIIWYPGIHGSDPGKNARSEAVCRVVAAVCRVQFTDLDTAGPQARDQWWSGKAARRMRELSGRPTLPLLYTYGGRYWPSSRIPEALRLCGAQTVIIYPGFDWWVSDALAITRLLRRVDRAGEPGGGES